MNNTTNPEDFDIPFDWLYRGKSNKSKKSKSSPISTTSNTQNNNKNRSRSVSISNAALQSDNTTTNKVSNSGDIAMSPVSKKERSSSTSTKTKPILTPPTTISSSSIPTQTVKRSSSMNDKHLFNTPTTPTTTKKSLFGSIFGSKKSISNNTTTKSSKQDNKIIIPNSSTISQQSINSASDITSPSIYSSIPSSSSSASSTLTQLTTISTESISDLNDIKLKRVTFSVDKFNGDPPQQLPTRKPKKGNILIPHELIDDNIPSISMGITNNLSNDSSSTEISKDSKEYKLALENYKKLLQETAIHQQEAHIAAKRIAREVQSYFSNTSGAISPPISEETTLDKNIEIDKPLHVDTHPFHDVMENEDDKDMTLDVIYTRCCHLREILPIPSTLRQVKGKTAPLHVLKFLNPKPTLIDILSFCDFISIVPINTIVFDNVNLSNEMFKILIKSLVNSQVLEKLSLKNVLITKENWLLFVKFLLTNKSLIKLDLSQTHLKFKQSDYSQQNVSTADPHCLRQNLDWDLFSKVISIRQGKPIEELLLNGVKFTNLPLEKFQNVLNSLTTQSSLQYIKPTKPVKCRLGLANSDLSLECLKIVLNWMSYKNQPSHVNLIIQGVDLAFNDLSTYVKSMVSRLSSLPFDNLEFFTLNNTNISRPYDLALILKYLSKLPNLKFLDLSNLPHLFPDVLPYIYKYLPRFQNLRRLHIDNNNLTYKQMGVICNILIKCKSITHISMLQPKMIPPTTADPSQQERHESVIQEDETATTTTPAQFAMNGLWAGLYRLVRDSPNLINLDVNYEDAPEEIQSRIALCLMRNMNKNMDTDFQLDELTVQDDLLFDGELITGGAEAIFKKLNKLIAEREAEGLPIGKSKAGDNAKKYLLKKYFENLHNVHENVIAKIDCLFEKRNSGELTMIEKENLLRFVMLEKNLAHIFEIFNQSKHLAPIIDSLKLKDDVQRKHCQSSTTINETIDTEVDNTSPVTENVQVRPHLMATDSGRTIDCLTGKPVLFRRSSTTSVQDKVYQEEEGELHKWGFFAQQQNMLYPEGTVTNVEPVMNEVSNNNATTTKQPVETSNGSMTPPCISTAMRNKLIAKVPSGDELRSAIIKARGIDSMHDLIQNVSDEPLGLESIYGDSVKVNETYDKLLNNLSANRPSK